MIHCVGDAFIICIRRLLLIIVGGDRQLLKNRLPGIGLFAVFVGSIIEIEHAGIGQVFQISPYLIIAGIDVIPVIL